MTMLSKLPSLRRFRTSSLELNGNCSIQGWIHNPVQMQAWSVSESTGARQQAPVLYQPAVAGENASYAPEDKRSYDSVIMTREEYEDAYFEALVCLREQVEVGQPVIIRRGRMCWIDGAYLTDKEVLQRWWGKQIAAQIIPPQHANDR